MYYPYFRGKQYELISVRDNSTLLAASNFVPIIEPVREALSGLDKAMTAVCDANGKAIVIVNPYYGDHRENGAGITEFVRGYVNTPSIGAGVLLRQDMTIGEAMELCERHSQHQLNFVHAGFTHGKELAQELGERLSATRQIFNEGFCPKTYRKHFIGSERVLLRDGFKRRRNRDYPPVELFSDLNVTFEEEGMNGFGDFSIVGDDYSESGGPAYAVAIHLTFIDPDQDDAIFIYHFVSESQDTPTDPAGKFAEALEKLMSKLDSGTSNLYETHAIQELRSLHAKRHFPGLGYLKKISLNHHIETLAQFFS
ncbi:sce7725 family protein [Pseudomonas mangiferae]|uniref:Sce7725 family protein n=1 Tax=Pseudomonas mangiferae TaxID=2593654 RepID=A0A553H026_9PSED|nr:sce7725 family protein [Pseudomonas mangiferae]TRX75096.1 sce7725 family protein [Pseudomonas mangiferae]